METLCLQNCSKHTLYNRVGKLLESVQWSDCSFLVGNEIIKAHRLILAISSPVFQAMLYGPMSQEKSIMVIDIEPDIFQMLIDFVYTDKVAIKSIDSACSLLYAAKKYLLHYLVDLCLEFIKESTNIENVISVFNFAEWIQEQRLVLYCLNLISQHASIALSMDFESLSAPCMNALLRQDTINLKEVDIIRMVLQWAEKLCTERGVAVTGKNLRLILDEIDIIKQLRFLTLSPDEINSLPKIDDILTLNEISAIRDVVCDLQKVKCSTQLQCINFLTTDASLQAICHNIEQRGPKKISWFYCCRPMIRSVSPLIIDNTCSRVFVKIKSEKTVLINSFLVPTRMSPQIMFSNESPVTYSEHIAVSIKLSDQNTEAEDSIVSNYMNVVDYNSSVYVELMEPYVFNKQEWYTVTFIWPKGKFQPYKYPISYRYLACERKVMFTFDDDCGCFSGSFLEGLKFAL